MNPAAGKSVRRVFGRAQASLVYRSRRTWRKYQRKFLDPILYSAMVVLGFGVVSTTIRQRRVKYAARSWRDAYRARTFHGERHILESLVAEAKLGDVVWDVGAHAGWYTIPLAKAIGPSGHVYSFEPVPELAEALKRNARLNGLANITVMPVALGHTEGTGSFKIDRSGLGGHHRLVPQRDARSIEVSVVTGDSLVENGRSALPTLLKIDVEGAEEDVLKGLRTTILHSALRVLVCEVEPSNPKSGMLEHSSIGNLLSGAGFSQLTWSRRGGNSHVYASRTAI